MDYEPALQRERKARKKAEKLLEEKSRELYFSNQELVKNVDTLNAELLKNSFLMDVSRYGVERQRLRDFFPVIVRDMLDVAKVPFGAFDHYSFDKKLGSYRSDIIFNEEILTEAECEGISNSAILSELLKEASEQVLEEKTCKVITDFNEAVAKGEKSEDFLTGIHSIVALPAVSLEHVSGVVYLFFSEGDDSQDKLIQLFQDAMQQLGIMIEHRHQDDKLMESYEEVKQANQALESAQKQLVQSEKMASVGQLSAGIAHEINNPMGFIKSNIGSLADYVEDLNQFVSSSKKLIELSAESENKNIQLEAGSLKALWKSVDMDFLLEDCSALLSESKQGVVRVVDIVSGLKRFARKSEDEKEHCNVCDNIEEALKLANNQLKYSVDISKSLEPVKDVVGHGGELTQVFLNMLINASHAIEENGDISITVKEDNNGVAVAIADTGCGIDQAHLDSIFDPFFTTKDVGVGTGLGLSISYGIIEDHGGTITVNSEVGKGTEFYIWLPYPESDCVVDEVKEGGNQ